jgi:plastocyanin
MKNMRYFFAALAAVGVACSGGESGSGETSASAAAAAPAEAATAAGTGAVHEVRMVLTEQGEYRYIPDELTIKVGDTVRWLNESGPPHNVAFYADRIPDGAAAVLNAAMPDRMGELTGPLFVQIGVVYEVSFAGAPTGQCDYFCTPHEMLGMVATLTVEQ